MFEFFKASKEDAIVILKNDHDKVKDLFEQFEKADSLKEKKMIAAEAIMELKIHAEIEEKIFYPAVRKELKKDMMNEADEEHHVAKLLIAELEQQKPTDDHWEAKFTVLSENIRHHIKEEESEMLPEARELKIDFEALGRQMLDMKEDLKKNGVPACDEEKLMARTKAKDDSPAKNAKPHAAPKTRAATKESKENYTSGSHTAAKKTTAAHGHKTAGHKVSKAKKA